MSSTLTAVDGAQIAYYQSGGAAPGVIFLGGFKSDMQGIKATSLESWCQQRDQAFLRFDYYGHGQSDGEFTEGNIGRWLADTLQVIDKLTQGPQILVGSSMGGWLMLHAALARPTRVAGLVGIACAADFSERLISAQLSADQKTSLKTQGYIERPSQYLDEPFVITAQFLEDGRQHLLLEGEIGIHCPIRLIHSTDDSDVPWTTSLEVSQKAVSQDIQLVLLKDAGHRLSRLSDIALIQQHVGELIEQIGN